MRIAMVGPFGFHPKKTMRSRAFRLARPLVARGHEVALFMPPWHTPEEAGRQWEEDGVRIHYVSLRGGTVGITHRLVREVLNTRPDVVHCFKPKAYSGLVAAWLWAFQRRRLRLVVDSDDWEGWGGWNERAPYSWLQKHFFAWQERWGLGHCHALTVASRALETLAWGHGVAGERVVYVPNGPGIPIAGGGGRAQERRAALGLAERPVLLLYSRLFEFDTQRLVAILRGVQARVPDVVLLAVGSGLYSEDAVALRRQLEAAGLARAVVDAGWVAEAELPALLAAADVGLYLMEDNLLNRSKCPVKLADMLAVGVPVVAERVGQVPEYVRHRETGLLRAPGEVEGLAGDLVTLLSEEPLRARLSENARAHIARHFSWERLADRVEVAYQTARSPGERGEPAALSGTH
ncbi:MAG: glycosyltransferase family 4 protein [Candidatus Promineifilaceae bacterium]|nr:glycosyltransferase family 4 protein [Candidatus Promineifilaceae bacterium]